jgi:hypothetical protein
MDVAQEHFGGAAPREVFRAGAGIAAIKSQGAHHGDREVLIEVAANAMFQNVLRTCHRIGGNGKSGCQRFEDDEPESVCAAGKDENIRRGVMVREIFSQPEELRAHGLGVPQVTEVAHELVARGVAVDRIPVTVEEGVEEAWKILNF